METQFSLKKKKKKQIGCILTVLICISPLSSQEQFFQHTAQALVFSLFSANNLSFLEETPQVNKEIKPIFFQLCFFRFFNNQLRQGKSCRPPQRNTVRLFQFYFFNMIFLNLDCGKKPYLPQLSYEIMIMLLNFRKCWNKRFSSLRALHCGGLPYIQEYVSENFSWQKVQFKPQIFLSVAVTSVI